MTRPAPDVELRVLTEDDWRSWRVLRHAALAEAPYAYGSILADWQGHGDREERWRDRLRAGHNLVAHLHGEPVGMASGVAGDIPDERLLVSMWVAPTGRGRGVGDLLVEAIADWARVSGAHTLVLHVVEQNPAARRLYERRGFAVLGPVQHQDPSVPPQLRMSRPL